MVDCVFQRCHSELTTAIQQILDCEELYISSMQYGIQRYSRPLRHRILTSHQHQTLFQNIEKVRTTVKIFLFLNLMIIVCERTVILRSLSNHTNTKLLNFMIILGKRCIYLNRWGQKLEF